MYCEWPELKRCCFCMPLRKGILVIAYLNVLICGFLIGFYSFVVNLTYIQFNLVYHGMSISLPAELSILIYVVEIGFNGLLIYGAHVRINKYLKIYYYFAISTTLAAVLMFILELTTTSFHPVIVEMFLFGFAGFCIQIYLLLLVWSLLKKLEDDGPNSYENQFHRILSSQTKVGSNGVYNPSTISHNIVIV